MNDRARHLHVRYDQADDELVVTWRSETSEDIGGTVDPEALETAVERAMASPGDEVVVED